MQFPKPSASPRLPVAFLAITGALGCGSSVTSAPSDAGVSSPIGDGAPVFSDAAPPDNQPPLDASKPRDDAGAYPICDGGGVLAADRFVTKVVSFTPGDCAGFGIPQMPVIVEGPPVGGGDSEGGLDVVSLGDRGSIVVSFEPNAIVDGPGADFIVFENAFFVAGNPQNPSAELGEVSVSDDGVAWTTFPCTATAYPYGACAGWHPVYSTPDNCISPVDPNVAGGDPFDLHDIGVTHARFVRIVDKSTSTCSPDPGQKMITNGFDLDAVSLIHAER
jgi:hypothetical protein